MAFYLPLPTLQPATSLSSLFGLSVEEWLTILNVGSDHLNTPLIIESNLSREGSGKKDFFGAISHQASHSNSLEMDNTMNKKIETQIKRDNYSQQLQACVT